MHNKGERIYSLEEQKDMLYNLEKHHTMPTKYVYFGIGAQRWIRVAESRLDPKGKGINILERMLLVEKSRSIIGSLAAYGYENFNLIDMGCGDGSPLYPILRYLKKEMPKSGLRYNPIDISPDMLSAASKNVGKGFAVFGKQNKWDFDKGNFRHITKTLEKPGFGNLYFFLGSTFGNMPNLHQTLVNIRESMSKDDYLLLGVEQIVPQEIGGMLRDYYDTRTIYDTLFTSFEFFGLRPSTGEFRIEFNRKLSQVEGYFTPDRDLLFTTAAGKTTLKKGVSIMLMRSVKFTSERLADLLANAGFRIELLTTSRKDNYALILVQPKSK